jgi:hypothetical protein
MREWFRAKYIERSEHQRVVAQYARLVRELRENLELLQTRTSRTSIHSVSAEICTNLTRWLSSIRYLRKKT